MFKHTLTMFAAAVLAFAVPDAASAQTSQTVSFASTVPLTGYIDVDATSLTIPTLTVANFQAGYSSSATLGIRYGSNGVIALGYQFDGYIVGQNTGTTLGNHRLEVQAPGGSYAPMDFQNTAWRTGIAAGNYTETLNFRLTLPNWNLPADTYGTAFRMLLAAG